MWRVWIRRPLEAVGSGASPRAGTGHSHIQRQHQGHPVAGLTSRAESCTPARALHVRQDSMLEFYAKTDLFASSYWHCSPLVYRHLAVLLVVAHFGLAGSRGSTNAQLFADIAG
jgi:hypothetical protein